MCNQFPELELSNIFNKLFLTAKKRKFQSSILYLLFLIYFSIPSFQIPILEYGSFRLTSLMEQRAIENYLFYFPRQSWVSINDVNVNLLRAIISMEDGSFFKHKGIDWKELNTSLKVNKRRGRSVRGASTITMQLSKNLYLTTSKNHLRKAKELIIAFRMEKELSKRAILQNYINAVEWGEDIFGIKKASKEYFKKEPSELNANDCSRLAAVIPSPLKHAPNVNSGYVLRRSSIIRGRLSDVVLFPEKEVRRKKKK